MARNPLLASIILRHRSMRRDKRKNRGEPGLGNVSPEEMALEVEQFLRAERENDKGSMH